MEKLIKAVSLFLSLLILSCNKTVDTEAPVIKIKSFVPSLQQGSVCGGLEDVIPMFGGDSLIIVVTFSDNENLSEYKLDIHSNFDCHGHNGNVGINIPAPNTSNQTTDWSLLDIQEISGQEQNLTLYLASPQNVTAGLYHFQIQAIDESGNDVPLANFYNLNLKNRVDTMPPNIILEEPISASLQANKGENIRFKGTLSDNYSLFAGGNGVLFLSYLDEGSGNTYLSNSVFQISEETTSYNFDFEFTIPNTLTSGNYTLYLGAFDGVRNVATAKSVRLSIN